MLEMLERHPWVWVGAIGLVTGALLGAVQKGRATLWRLAVGRVATTITVDSDDPLFHWVKVWLSRHPYTDRSRTLQAGTDTSQDGGGVIQTVGGIRVMFIPGLGTHWFRQGLTWVAVSKSQEQEAKALSTNGRPASRRESYSITVFTRTPATARKILTDALTDALTGGEGRKTTFYGLSTWGSWMVADQRRARDADSVVLAEGLWEDIRADLTRFKASEAKYRALGVPYRRGYLFKGPPGSGKTSMAVALAGLAGMDVCILSLADPAITDAKLRTLMDGASAGSMILIEDVDAAVSGRNVNTNGNLTTGDSLTFSGVLNALDGAAAKEGRVVVMTTNHPERLDDALVRPGRIDRQWYIGPADHSQAVRLFRRFYPAAESEWASLFADGVPPGTSMATLQGYLLSRADHAALAVAETDRLNAEAESKPEAVEAA